MPRGNGKRISPETGKIKKILGKSSTIKQIFAKEKRLRDDSKSKFVQELIFYVNQFFNSCEVKCKPLIDIKRKTDLI